MNGLDFEERELTEALLKRLEPPLPQRCGNVDTGEMLDEYRVSVSEKERDHLIRILMRSRHSR